jgi:hypothetical protein
MSSVEVFVRLSGKTLTDADGEGYQVNSVECPKGPMLNGEVHRR